MSKFTSDACTYGCKHEAEARQEYAYQMQTTRTSFKIMNSGLALHPMYPFMGVSPDGLVSCSCCGNGLVEINYLYMCKDKEVPSECSSFCLFIDDSGDLRLKENHQYFYQT